MCFWRNYQFDLGRLLYTLFGLLDCVKIAFWVFFFLLILTGIVIFVCSLLCLLVIALGIGRSTGVNREVISNLTHSVALESELL